MTDALAPTLAELVAGGGLDVQQHHALGPGLWFCRHWEIIGVGRTPAEAIQDFNAAAHESSGATATGQELRENALAAERERHDRAAMEAGRG